MLRMMVRRIAAYLVTTHASCLPADRSGSSVATPAALASRSAHDREQECRFSRPIDPPISFLLSPHFSRLSTLTVTIATDLLPRNTHFTHMLRIALFLSPSSSLGEQAQSLSPPLSAAPAKTPAVVTGSQRIAEKEPDNRATKASATHVFLALVQLTSPHQ